MIERSADIYKSCIFDLTAFNLVGRISRLQFRVAEFSLIPLFRRHYARVEFREFTGTEALQYSANFAFCMKVIDDAHIDRVKRSINYINFESSCREGDASSVARTKVRWCEGSCSMVIF